MSLYLINQIGKLLNSSSDLMRSMNSVLVSLPDYLPVRNPVLLIRDQVINKFFIDLAPELTEEQKNRWNQKRQEVDEHKTTLTLAHQMVLYPGDKDVLELPQPDSLARMSLPKIMQPVIFKQTNLPLALLYTQVSEFERVGEVQRIFTFMADMLALSMAARGFPVSEITESQAPELEVPHILENIVGESEALQQMAEVVKKVASSKATVLIQGESGTGKELIAKAIHNHSLHRKAPFVGVNCAALSEHLLESELFGHEKGAFTGATVARKGRFELADGGTLFLDEIGDTSLGFQTKILRVLQEGSFERLGGNETLHVDVRILAATNVDLELAIERGSFREDLFYRLNVIRLFVPPLRERLGDIPHLVRHFLNYFNSQENKNIRIRDEDLAYLAKLDWPGNVRELENTVHSGFLMEREGWFHLDRGGRRSLPLRPRPAPVAPQPPAWVGPEADNTRAEVMQEEVSAIEEALLLAKGIQIKAAEDLGISLRQLRYRIQKYGIKVRKIRG